MKKESVSTFIKVVISLGLMAFLFYRFLSDPAEREILFNYLAGANYWYLLAALALFVLAIIVNAVKWYILLRAQGVPVPLMALINYTFVGFFFNNFLPANVGGDVIRGFGVARYTDRGADAAVSVIVDRIIGLMGYMFSAVVAALVVVNILMRGGSLGTMAVNESLAQNMAQVQIIAVIGLIAMVGGFALVLSHRLRALIGRIFNWKFLKPLAPLYGRLSDAFGAYRYQYMALLWAFLLGVANILLTSLVDIAIVAGLHGYIPPVYIFLFNPIIAVILIVPISIGGLGAMSALYVYFYGLVGVPETLAFALSLVKQAIIYLGSLPGGVLWLRKQQHSGEQSSG
ncbi:MAG TPA: flippase-like domain-containing protein [Chloroflexi bacterium]|nr:flippase-like domain-containing protein [Chloroflexota bacterium]